MPSPLPTQSQLREMFAYSEARTCIQHRESGTWYHYTAPVGGGKWRLVSRIIWKMFHDEEPPVVDHRDNTGVNRLSNLRAAWHGENQGWAHDHYVAIVEQNREEWLDLRSRRYGD